MYINLFENKTKKSQMKVHERQTARMRTRSEWFLGPRDSELALNLPSTCSNCCLTAVQKQQLQLQQQHPHFQAHGYLGGGSTRDMRAHCGGFDDNEDDNVHNLIVSNSGGHNANALYLYYKKRLHQQQKFNANPQQAMQTEHMDTDDRCNAYVYGPPTYQCKQHLQVETSNVYPQSPEFRLMEPTSSAFAAASNSSGRRMYLDPNATATNIGSYVTSHKSSNNNYLYDSNDTTKASAFTTNSIATTSTSTTTTFSLQTNSISTSAKLSIDISHKYNYNTNNNSKSIYIENAMCNNNNIENNNTNQTLLESNRQHIYNLSNTKCSNSATKPVSTHYEPHRRNHQNISSQKRNIDSSSYLHTHSQSPNHQRQNQTTKRGSKLPSHYHSTDSVRYCDVDLDVEIVTEPTMSTSRLFYSPRKQIFSARRCNSTQDLYKVDGANVEGKSDIDHNYLTYSLPSDHNQADFDAVTVPSTLTNRSESCEIYSDSSEFLNASLLDNSLATVSTTSAMNGGSSLPLASAEEVDFIHTSRYRQSTPRVQRRQQMLRRRQRLGSTSTQYHSIISTNTSNLLMTTADGGNGSDSGNSRNTRTESGNNFVTVIFNILDFLF